MWIDGVRPSGGRCCADHPAFIFHVVGQSRDDRPTAVQAGGNHPGSHYACPQNTRAVVTITPVGGGRGPSPGSLEKAMDGSVQPGPEGAPSQGRADTVR